MPQKNSHIYDHKKIEPKWQKNWASKKIYKTKEIAGKPKCYVLDMFPYPSGAGLHVGHPKGYIGTDIYARYKTMKGFNVLHPMGWDAFGLPAEEYAIKNKFHPAVAVAKNVARYKKQLSIIGLNYDWEREINTTDPAFYKWTQWTFLQMLKRGLAYQSYEPINWCPSCQTGLANEDLEGGVCERCGSPVEKKPMRQWMLRITKYADRLLADLDAVDDNIPVFIRRSGLDGVKKGLPLEEREAVVCVVKHWSEEKYLGLHWKKNGWQGFVIGGIEKGEDPSLAAVREIQEETGYQNIRYVRTLGRLDSQFYHAVKKVNRFAHFTCLYLELTDGEQKEIADGEKELHELKWLSRDEMADFFTHDDMRHAWKLFLGEEKPSLSQPLLDWPRSVKESQRNWIGRSEGAILRFKIQDLGFKDNEEIEVFTTRPDTLFGATYLVLAPEHPLVEKIIGGLENKEEVKKHITETKKKTEIERGAVLRAKTGVKLERVEAINPATGETIPVFIADYVLEGYGTGAIMAVPGHDERDYAFAQAFNLPIVQVIRRTNFSTLSVVIHDQNQSALAVSLRSMSAAKDHVTPEDRQYEFSREAIPSLIEILQEYKVGTPADFERIKNGENFFLTNDRPGLNFNVVYLEEGVLINSGSFNGLTTEEARKKITDFVGGRWQAVYKLRDWVFSRQRYWGEPIPVVHCARCAETNPASGGVVPVPEKDLPVLLPKVKSYAPTGTGESPLAAIEKWVATKCPVCKGPAKRETNTMPQWAGSSWYYLRYLDPANKKSLVDKKKEKYWSPVDMYVGGTEHATRHLIYARFWHKFLYDIGVVNYPEPFAKLKNQGLIAGPDGRKMSKRWGNVINPDDIVKTYGADTLRVYEMFMGPFEQGALWSTESIIGPRRFLDRVWRLAERVEEKAVPNPTLVTLLHRTIKKVGSDIESFNFNTAVSTLMIFLAEMEKAATLERKIFESFLLLLAPYAPHLAEELWQNFGHKKSIHQEEWPLYDEALIQMDEVKITLQVNGRVRGFLVVAAGEPEEKIREQALLLPAIAKWLPDGKYRQVIFVPNRLMNFVV